ncbi:ankyrin repeat domain-containing protein [Rhodoferax sp. GW822-FHT02A01]|uniref:ankyrin repeat domain-containing protein n=1 Tax=Rhodoferax sp. GW822-FHT02A01 TaxID=3141537 RepID=UPI00315D8D56
MHYLKRFLYLYVFVVFSCAHAGSYEDFFVAITHDNTHELKALLARGIDPNTVNPEGQYALLVALRQDSFAAAQLLISQPSTLIEVRSNKDESPLMLAALKGQTAICRQLLDRDADVNKTGWTALHYAATGGHPEIVRLLLDHYAYIDAESPNGTTPLMMAAMYGNADTVQVLLDAGADVTVKNAQGLSALEFAQKNQNASTVPAILAAIRAINSKAGW